MSPKNELLMDRTPELFEKIENYLSGDLTEQEKSDFEKQVNNNPQLKNELDNHRSLHGALKDSDALEFRKKLNKIGEEIYSGNTGFKSIKRSHSRYWQIAAAVAIIVGLSTIWLMQQSNNTENLFATYYKAFPSEDLLRGNSDQEIGDVVKEYAAGNYKEVIPKLSALSNKYPDQTDLKLYLSSSLLVTGETSLAIDILNDIEVDNKYYEDGQWYLALSYLKTGDLTKTRDALEKVIGYNGIYKEDAVDLLGKLKN